MCLAAHNIERATSQRNELECLHIYVDIYMSFGLNYYHPWESVFESGVATLLIIALQQQHHKYTTNNLYESFSVWIVSSPFQRCSVKVQSLSIFSALVWMCCYCCCFFTIFTMGNCARTLHHLCFERYKDDDIVSITKAFTQMNIWNEVNFWPVFSYIFLSFSRSIGSRYIVTLSLILVKQKDAAFRGVHTLELDEFLQENRPEWIYFYMVFLPAIPYRNVKFVFIGICFFLILSILMKICSFFSTNENECVDQIFQLVRVEVIVHVNVSTRLLINAKIRSFVK